MRPQRSALTRTGVAALAVATTSAFASDASAPFPVYVTLTVQRLACDPYTSLSSCAKYGALSGTLTVSEPTGAVATLALGVDGESTDDKHKGEIELRSFNAGTALSFSFGGSYQSLGSPLPAAHPAFAFAPGVVAGPAQGVPVAAPGIALGAPASAAFSPIDLTGSIYAFGTTKVIGSWEATVSSVPEPSAWTMTAAGLAVFGALLRRRRPRAA